MNSDARPHRSTDRGRALLAFSAVAALVGIGLVAWAIGRDRPRTVFETTDAVAATIPSTVPPLVDETTTSEPAEPVDGSTGGSTGDDVAADSASDDGARADDDASSLAALLGPSGSAIPPEIEPRVAPARLLIDEIYVADPVRAVGLEDDGELEVPDETEIGWYRYGSSPGRPGATVLAAHVTWNGSYGPFYNLTALDPGELVTVELADGSQRIYSVIERTIYGKDELPADRIWRTDGPETLVLITCGGSFNEDISRYRENIVVYAVPIA